MATHSIPTPVYIRIGERSEANVGTVQADHTGRVDPHEFALFLRACAAEVQSQVDTERAQWRTSKENTHAE